MNNNTKKSQEVPGNKIKLLLDTKMTSIVVAVIILAIYCFLSLYIERFVGMERRLLEIVLFLLQFIATTICVDFLQSITTLQDEYQKIERIIQKTVDEKLNSFNDIAKNYQDELNNVQKCWNYVINPQSFPFDKMTDEALSVLFDKAADQKVKNKEQILQLEDKTEIKELYDQCMSNIRNQYLKRIDTLERGFLNTQFGRDIRVNPQENGFEIETTIRFDMYIPPNIEEERRKYRYIQSFDTEEEAQSFEIKSCKVNNSTRERRKTIQKVNNKYIVEHEEILESHRINSYILECSYMEIGAEFKKTYRVAEDCKNYSFVCELPPDKMQEWQIEFFVAEMKLVKDAPNALLPKETERGYELNINGNGWILSGSIITVQVRKKNV